MPATMKVTGWTVEGMMWSTGEGNIRVEVDEDGDVEIVGPDGSAIYLSPADVPALIEALEAAVA